MFEQDYETANFAQIKVIGVGGAAATPSTGWCSTACAAWSSSR